MENIRRLKEVYDKVLEKLGYTISIGDDFDSIRILANNHPLGSRTIHTDKEYSTTFDNAGIKVVSIKSDGLLTINLQDGLSIEIYYDCTTKKIGFIITKKDDNEENRKIVFRISDINNSSSLNIDVNAFISRFNETKGIRMEINQGEYNGSVKYSSHDQIKEIATTKENYLNEVDNFIYNYAFQILHEAWALIHPAIELCINNMTSFWRSGIDDAIRSMNEEKDKFERSYQQTMAQYNTYLEFLYAAKYGISQEKSDGNGQK